MKKLLILFLLPFVITSCNDKESADIMEKVSVQSIDCYTMKERIIEGAILIDVRTETEFADGSIEFAINVPVENLESNIKNVVTDLDTPIIVFCRSGKRSSTAANKLIELGYKNVYDLGSIDNCN